MEALTLAVEVGVESEEGGLDLESAVWGGVGEGAHLHEEPVGVGGKDEPGGGDEGESSGVGVGAG